MAPDSTTTAKSVFLQDVALQSHPPTFFRNLILNHLPWCAKALSHFAGSSEIINQVIEEANRGDFCKVSRIWHLCEVDSAAIPTCVKLQCAYV